MSVGEHGLTADQIAEIVSASREAQGMPERIADPVTLRAVGVLVENVRVERGAA
jgi:hypothetical protein